jgi:hypothetical protein
VVCPTGRWPIQNGGRRGGKSYDNGSYSGRVGQPHLFEGKYIIFFL